MPLDIEVVTFNEALAQGTRFAKKHLLLGNGFSRALRNDIFSYDTLFDSARFDTLSPSVRLAFEVLATTDFEFVMRALRAAAALVIINAASGPALAKRLRDDEDALREPLVRTIAANHPDEPGDVPTEAYAIRQ